eukprot:5418727-Amphidinium_carterae.1
MSSMHKRIMHKDKQTHVTGQGCTLNVKSAKKPSSLNCVHRQGHVHAIKAQRHRDMFKATMHKTQDPQTSPTAATASPPRPK